jgi:hypothetical protein
MEFGRSGAFEGAEKGVAEARERTEDSCEAVEKLL